MWGCHAMCFAAVAQSLLFTLHKVNLDTIILDTATLDTATLDPITLDIAHGLDVY
jgi:hypothetical protein